MKRFIGIGMGLVLGIILSGCGQSGFVVSAQGGVSSRSRLPQHPPEAGLTLSTGPGTRVGLGTVHLTIPPSNLSSIPSLQWHAIWVPLIQVPTVTGMQDRVRGQAVFRLPAQWTGPTPQDHWSGYGSLVTTNVNMKIPPHTRNGGVITLAERIRVALVQGRSTAGGRQTLVIATPPAFPVLAWQDATGTPSVSRTKVTSMKEGLYMGFQPPDGGTTAFAVQSRHWSSAEGLAFAIRTRYQLALDAVQANVILYDRGTHGAYWYIQRFPSPQSLPQP